MKRVFSNFSQVIHLWANQSQSDARCSNVYFSGKNIYSYGSHYLLGTFVQYKGVQVAMINSRGYSVTTAKHIRGAQRATSHLVALSTTGDMSDVRGALVEMQGKLVDQLFNHFNSLNQWSYKYGRFDRSDGYGPNIDVNKFNALCLKLKHPELCLDVNDDFVDSYNAHTAMRVKIGKIKNAEKIAQAELRRIETAKMAVDQLAIWRATGLRGNQLWSIKPQCLRVTGNMVETTGGAEVSVRAACRPLKAVLAGKIVRGEEIDGFKVISKVDGIIKIGCHDIAISEAKAVLGNLLENSNTKLELGESLETV